MPLTTTPRRDRSAAVKEAIRASAGRLFTERGFDATGVRDIAADAEVNPALVIRHFGSKEALFIETVDASGAWPTLLDGPIEDLGRRSVRGILKGSRTGSLSIFGTVVRASGRSDIHASLRTSIVARFALPLVERLHGPDAKVRAHLFAAQLTGLMTALVVYDDAFLGGADDDVVVQIYGDSLQMILTGPVGVVASVES